MLPAHLQALLQESSSVFIVVDNAKCHVNAFTKKSSSPPCCYEETTATKRSRQARVGPRPTRPRQSRWESEPVAVAASSMMKSLPARPNHYCIDSSSRNDLVKSAAAGGHAGNGETTATGCSSSLYSSLQRQRNDSCKNNAAKPSRRSTTTTTMMVMKSSKHFQLQFPILVNDKMKNVSTANLLSIALDDLSFNENDNALFQEEEQECTRTTTATIPMAAC